VEGVEGVDLSAPFDGVGGKSCFRFLADIIAGDIDLNSGDCPRRRRLLLTAELGVWGMGV
jgi:hypothetical protein